MGSSCSSSPTSSRAKKRCVTYPTCRFASPLRRASIRRSTFGVGYGTEEQARARIRWDHLNFLGDARHAGFEGKWSSLDRGVRAEYREPFFLSSHFSLNFDGQAWQAEEPVYSLDTLGGRFTLRHQANAQNVWSISFSNEFQRSSVTPEALEDFTIRDELIALGLDPHRRRVHGNARPRLRSTSSRNTTDNLLDARTGYVLTGAHRTGGQVAARDVELLVGNGEGRHYLPVGRSMVVANRLRVGTIDALGDLAAQRACSTSGSSLAAHRASAGGAASRWARSAASACRLAATRCLKGPPRSACRSGASSVAVAFLDYGNVWSRSWDFNLRRSSLCRRSRPSLHDADRPGSRRFRIPAQSDRQPPGEWRTGAAALASAFQYRSGVLVDDYWYVLDELLPAAPLSRPRNRARRLVVTGNASAHPPH